MSAQVVGLEDGELALFEVWRESVDGGGAASRAKVWEVMGEVRGGRVKGEAPFVYEHQSRDTLTPGEKDRSVYETAHEAAPSLHVEVSAGGAHRARSGPLRLRSVVDLSLTSGGKPVPGERYVVLFANGERREGTLDREGKAVVDPAPPFRHHVEFPDRARVQRAAPSPDQGARRASPTGGSAIIVPL